MRKLSPLGEKLSTEWKFLRTVLSRSLYISDFLIGLVVNVDFKAPKIEPVDFARRAPASFDFPGLANLASVFA